MKWTCSFPGKPLLRQQDPSAIFVMNYIINHSRFSRDFFQVQDILEMYASKDTDRQSIARVHTNRSNRRAREGVESKPSFKSVLSNPFEVKWCVLTFIATFHSLNCTPKANNIAQCAKCCARPTYGASG